MRILVVDDNEDGAESIAMLLQMFGHEVGVAHNGHDGVAKATLEKPDAILLDIGLPDMDGYEVAKLMRAEPALASTVLIAMTGWGSADDKRTAELAGFDYHLTKPVDAPELEKLLLEARR